jgi:DNA-binding IclR family transcriptional regulator
VSDSLSGVGVLDKAVLILKTLEAGPLSLAELSLSTSMPRATAHRLATALETHRLVQRDPHGRFVLGHGLVRLGRAANNRASRSLADAAGSALERLRNATRESAQLYVRSGDTRVCIASLESPHSLRTIVAVGAALPMDRGSAAKILAGDPEAVRRGWADSVEEREKGVASVSAPVYLDGEIVAAISVSGPVERTTRQPGRKYAADVRAAARALELVLDESASHRVP